MGKYEDLKNYTFSYENRVLSFYNDKNYKIYSINNEYYVETPFYTGKLSNIDNAVLQQDIKMNILLIVFSEFTNENKDNETTFSSIVQNQNIIEFSACSFWDTKYSVGVGLNRSAAEANLTHNIAEDMMSGEIEGCISIGGRESYSVGVVHYSVQAWCC